jgi:hypothetical protein
MTRALPALLLCLAACDAPDPLGVRSAEILPEVEPAAPAQAPRAGAAAAAELSRVVRAQAAEVVSAGGCGQAEAAPTPVVAAAAGGCGRHAEAAGAGGCDCGGDCDGSCGHHPTGGAAPGARPELSPATLSGLGPRGARLGPTGASGGGSCGH